ncbi:hypothetical protein TNCT_440581, partial [Trichonephila clavata]
ISFDRASLENQASESICSVYNFTVDNLTTHILESDLALSSSKDFEVSIKYEFMVNTNKKKLENQSSGSFSSDDNLNKVKNDFTNVENITKNDSALSNSKVNENELHAKTESSQNLKYNIKDYEMNHDLTSMRSSNKCEIQSKKCKYPFESDQGNSERNSKKVIRDGIAEIIESLFEDPQDMFIKCENPMNVQSIILEGCNTCEEDDKDIKIDRDEKKNNSEIQYIPLKMPYTL